jgi:hypothetical protein
LRGDKFSTPSKSIAAKSIVLAIFVMAATSSIKVIRSLGSPATSTKAIRLLFPGILAWVFLSMMIDYFNGCVRAHSLSIAAQIKIMGEPLLLFLDLWFGIYLQLPLEKYKIVS